MLEKMWKKGKPPTLWLGMWSHYGKQHEVFLRKVRIE